MSACRCPERNWCLFSPTRFGGCGGGTRILRRTGRRALRCPTTHASMSAPDRRTLRFRLRRCQSLHQTNGPVGLHSSSCIFTASSWTWARVRGRQQSATCGDHVVAIGRAAALHGAEARGQDARSEGVPPCPSGSARCSLCFGHSPKSRPKRHDFEPTRSNLQSVFQSSHVCGKPGRLPAPSVLRPSVLFLSSLIPHALLR